MCSCVQAVNIQATDMAAKCGKDDALGSIDEALPWYLKVDSLTWQVQHAAYYLHHMCSSTILCWCSESCSSRAVNMMCCHWLICLIRSPGRYGMPQIICSIP
jgi:hypothetical protein